MTRAPLILGLTLFVVGVSGALSAPRAERKTPRSVAEARRAVPINTLVAQLHRRFSDTRDVDFGFSRISRPLARLHYGATMDRNDLIYLKPGQDGDGSLAMNTKLVRRAKEDGYELKTENGTWIPLDQARDQMRAENATERRAIEQLRAQGREIAIYTFGAFQDGHANRWHGPAYLRQLGPKAPDSENLTAIAEGAWAGGKPNLPGYQIRTERIFAEASCVKCHNEMSATMTPTKLGKVHYKKGDVLGLIVIAEKT